MKVKNKGDGLTVEEKQISKDYFKCLHKKGKSPWKKHKRPAFNKSISREENWKKIDQSRREFKKTHKKELDAFWKKDKKVYKECSKKNRKQKNTLKKKYKKEIKKRSEKCCKCHYVKVGKTLRKVKGPWPHCSYDMSNCCKDNKTIVKYKKGGDAHPHRL